MKYAVYDTKDEAEKVSKQLGSDVVKGRVWDLYSPVVDMPDGKFGFYVITEGVLSADHLLDEGTETVEVSEHLLTPEEISNIQEDDG